MDANQTDGAAVSQPSYQAFAGHSGARLVNTLAIESHPLVTITCDFDNSYDPTEIVGYVDAYSDETIPITSNISDGYHKLNVNIITRLQNSSTTLEITDSWMRVYISPDNQADVSHLLTFLSGQPGFSMDVVIPTAYL